MDRIQNKAKLEVLLHSMGLSRLYAAVPDAFRLVRFHKGELLTQPEVLLQDVLFLAEGGVHIYGLRENGSSFSVTLVEKGTVLGDFEYLQHASLPFYTEADEDVLCVAMRTGPYRPVLEQNADFLHLLLDSLSSKFRLIFLIGNASQPIEEKLLIYLRDLQPDHQIHSISAMTRKLQCSRSQLQRVVRSLCGSGILEHIGKGRYRLASPPATGQQ